MNLDETKLCTDTNNILDSRFQPCYFNFNWFTSSHCAIGPTLEQTGLPWGERKLCEAEITKINNYENLVLKHTIWKLVISRAY